MKVTLVTPLRNERDNVEKLWNAIQAQSRRPDEWIIMDNGSTDGTDGWLEEAARSSPFPVRVMRMPGRTIAQMTNDAIEEAEGEVIAGCHGGTRIPPEWLERLLAPLAADPGVDVSAGVWVAYGETPFESWLAATMQVSVAQFDEKTYLPATRSIAFKRSAWETVGKFPEWLPRFGEDTLFAIRLRTAGLKIVVARDAVVGWRPKPSVRSFMRQERLYTEANTLMGLFVPSWRYAVRPWGALPVVALAGALAGFWVGVAVLAALPLLDALRLKLKGVFRFPSLRAYLFWMWVMPLAYQAGYLNAKRMAVQLDVRRPIEDERAVVAYLKEVNAS